MTLAFSTQLNGKATYFVEKITLSLLNAGEISRCKASEILATPITEIPKLGIKPKLHTIREDLKNKWRPDMLIHFVINNRTPNRKQFAPTVQCTWIQTIQITHYVDFISVTIDGQKMKPDVIEKLAINDGFDSVKDFFAYFNKDFKGKIIHWTNINY